MIDYETLCLVSPDLSEEEVNTFKSKIEGIIASFKGKVKKTEDWGLKKLAYEVKKKNKGRYILFQYAGGGTLVHEIERTLRLLDHSFKFLTVKIDNIKLQKVAKAKEKEKIASQPDETKA